MSFKPQTKIKLKNKEGIDKKVEKFELKLNTKVNQTGGKLNNKVN